MLTLTLLAALIAQDAGRLIDDLGSDDLNTRAAAERKLLELGTAARDALKAAANQKDADFQSRVRALLSDARMLPIDASTRESMHALQSATDTEMLANAVESLFKVERAKLREALAVAVKEGGAALRGRSTQIEALLALDCITPMRYGLILLETEMSKGGELVGVEVFVNETKAPVSIAHASGNARYEEVKLDEEVGARTGATFTIEEPSRIALTIAPGAAYTLQRPDLAVEGAVKGRYAIWMKYRSGDVDKKPDNFWSGTLESNRVEFRIK